MVRQVGAVSAVAAVTILWISDKAGNMRRSTSNLCIMITITTSR